MQLVGKPDGEFFKLMLDNSNGERGPENRCIDIF